MRRFWEDSTNYLTYIQFLIYNLEDSARVEFHLSPENMPIDYSKWDALEDTDLENDSMPPTLAVNQKPCNSTARPRFRVPHAELRTGDLAELTHGAEPVLHVMVSFMEIAMQKIQTGYCFYHKCAKQASPEFTCQGCGLIPYCSQECQEADWQDWHFDSCANVRSERHGFVGVVTLQRDIVISQVDHGSGSHLHAMQSKNLLLSSWNSLGDAMEAIGMQHGDNIFVEGLDNSFPAQRPSSTAHRMQCLSECVHPCRLIVVGLTDHGGAAAPLYRCQCTLHQFAKGQFVVSIRNKNRYTSLLHYLY